MGEGLFEPIRRGGGLFEGGKEGLMINRFQQGPLMGGDGGKGRLMSGIDGEGGVVNACQQGRALDRGLDLRLGPEIHARTVGIACLQLDRRHGAPFVSRQIYVA